MEFSRPLVPGRLIRRYKRFLADVELEDGQVVTAHCANPGSMLGLKTPGIRVWLEPNDDPKRKLKFAWKLVELESGLAGIDTGVPNRVVGEALMAKMIPELSSYETIRPEQKYGEKSRIDFLLTEDGLPDAYVEVKNVHLMRKQGLAEFPDSVTARGAKHLAELANEVANGNRAIMLYVVQMDGPERFDLSRDIDPIYGDAFDAATSQGVEVLVWRCMLDTTRITLDRPIPSVAGPIATRNERL
ncbi:MAG: DNA/RNA nuclease SfsA [Pseudomonadota bacterium]